MLLLEAGRDYDPRVETPMFNIYAEAPLRGVGTPDKPFGFYDATVDGGWQVPNEPYTVAEGSEPFIWWRPRMLGGRTNHWGRIALRFGPLDFKPYSRDGLGYDWPIAYDDLAPWYDRTEKLIGVSGAAPPRGLLNTPDSPAGCLMESAPPRAFEIFYERAFRAMGIPVIPMHGAVVTGAMEGRNTCLFATPCGRGCAIGANFQSTTVLLPPAMATGNLTIRTDALVYQVDLDKAGKAKGVTFVDRKTGEHHSVTAKSVVLAAGSGETARILLNSKSAGFPNGLCNTHGMVGRYLMDSVGTGVTGQFPAMEGLPPTNDDGQGTQHTYVPWWGYEKQKELGFARGYHIEIGGGRHMPSMGLAGVLPDDELSVGDALREKLRNRFGSTIGFDGRGEMIPNDDCYCELDPTTKDKWGIPVLRFHWKWGEHETNQAAHAVKTFLEVIDRLGGTPEPGVETDGRKAISKGGEMIHEIGTVRMGHNETDSVVNQYGQSWAVPNLFVMDGAVMVSSPDKNPTLSILALAWRSADNLASLARQGAL
ncbi:MAG: glucose-methanol-choline oxidoreductase [Phenylobacterium sp.]|uniref:GMC family oxidoreductase n=1 Tax=Phenylobacterium sp. TaxID=1871053 RepID=UPI002607EA4C|nr:GMC family oxidoreductase [Phenylobacterium sp.]MDB5499999.1 glucose-methanol-choline oxidoreductase [Phenylobacterium sp.]